MCLYLLSPDFCPAILVQWNKKMLPTFTIQLFAACFDAWPSEMGVTSEGLGYIPSWNADARQPRLV